MLYPRINYIPYECLACLRIRFGYRDPSVRPSSPKTRIPRVGRWASGSFATKSRYTSTTICLQRRNFPPCSREIFARRASNTPTAFSKDACVAFAISRCNLAVNVCHSPQAVHHVECILPRTYLGQVHPAVPGSNRKERPFPSGERVQYCRGHRIKRPDERRN